MGSANVLKLIIDAIVSCYVFSSALFTNQPKIAAGNNTILTAKILINIPSINTKSISGVPSQFGLAIA